MTFVETLDKQPKTALWDQLNRESAVLLGFSDSRAETLAPVTGPDMEPVMLPMKAFPDSHSDTIWFFADRSSDQFKNLKGKVHARLCISNGTDNFWADIRGTLEEQQHCDVVAAKWNLATEAWYEKGKSDPNLMLLAFKPRLADLSASTASQIELGYETAKAILTKQNKPDVSVRKQVSF